MASTVVCAGREEEGRGEKKIKERRREGGNEGKQRWEEEGGKRGQRKNEVRGGTTHGQYDTIICHVRTASQS